MAEAMRYYYAMPNKMIETHVYVGWSRKEPVFRTILVLGLRSFVASCAGSCGGPGS